MSPYTLQIGFTPEELSVLNTSGTNVAIAKPTAGGQPNVAWIVFQPMVSNTISWVEQYGIYVSNTAIENDRIIAPLAATQPGTASGKMYTASSSGRIYTSGAEGMPDAFSLTNSDTTGPYSLTAGLCQGLTINGTVFPANIVSAQPLMPASTVAMIPGVTLFIWLQSGVKSGMVSPPVTSLVTRISYTGGVREMSVQYDAASGKFIPSGKRAGNAAGYSEPVLQAGNMLRLIAQS